MRKLIALLALVVTLSVAVTTGAAQSNPDVQVPDDSSGDSGVMPSDPGDVVTDPSFGIGAAVGAVGVGIAAWLAFQGGAKFVTKDNVLENDTREAIFELLQDKPGLHLRAISDELELSTTNVLWHLRKLKDADLVKGKKLEGYKVFYPVKGGQESQREAMASAVLRNENAKAILEYISTEPGAHQRAIARGLDVNHGTVRWHLRKMLKTDLVLEVEQNNAKQYYLTELGASVMGQPATGHEGTQAGSGQAAA